MTDHVDLAADLERARSIACSLEADCARLEAANAELRALATFVLKFAAQLTDGPMPDVGDGVGVESMPVGDPWGDGVIIPKDWQDPAPRVLDGPTLADCACGGDMATVHHGELRCCGPECGDAA